MLSTPYFDNVKLIDTHTHFDVPEYDDRRDDYIARALIQGVRHVVLIGLTAERFDKMVNTQAYTQNTFIHHQQLHSHLAMGLHPLYIAQHHDDDLQKLDNYLATYPNLAIGEIGLDNYPTEFGNQALMDKQKYFFAEQLKLAKKHHLPILLHIRRSHGDVLGLLKQHKFNLGGIAHSFSGGEQEAVAFIKLGFKLGITGQITNPNAKKLHRTIKAVIDRYGIDPLVIETDSPDMTPLPCQQLPMNEPATLPYVLEALSQITGINPLTLSQKLWDNTCQAFNYTFCYD